jgi:epoxyqueuosine reductase
MDLKQYIITEGLDLGFSKVGIAPAEYQPVYHDKYLNWLKNGCQAGMDYLEKGARKRFDPKIHIPDAASVIVCAHNYYTEPANDPGKGYVSIYARGEDYHKVIDGKLRRLCEKIQADYGDFKYRTLVDTSPISEKTFAVLAGIGFIGRNNTVIIPKDKSDERSPRGSFHFLGVIITDLDIEPDPPIQGTCGKCTRCIDACPTAAIVDDGIVDAGKCVSYHTTQNKGEIPEDIAAAMKNMFWGCDVCQTVCPYNSKALLNSEPKFHPKEFLIDFDPRGFLEMSDEEFKNQYADTAIYDLGIDRARRNAMIIINNIV